jgi:hypothetical protein
MLDGTYQLVKLISGVCMLGSAIVAPGCKHITKSDDVSTEGIEIIDAESNVASSDRRGIDVQLMVVDDTDYDTPRALHTHQGLQDDLVRSRWAQWGFRLVEVPRSDIESLLGSLRPVQPVSVKWMGEFGQWRPIVRTGQINQSRVRVGDSTASIASGRASLVARSWIEPILTNSGVEQVVRLDMGIQMEQPRQRQFGLGESSRERTLDDGGAVIDELLSSVTLREGTVLVIVGEAPGADWAMLPEPRVVEPIVLDNGQIGPNEDEDEDSNSESQGQESKPPFTGESAAAQGNIGALQPQAPRLRSLGELMLTAQGSRLVRANESRTVPKRVLIVIVPEIYQHHEQLDGGLAQDRVAS